MEHYIASFSRHKIFYLLLTGSLICSGLYVLNPENSLGLLLASPALPIAVLAPYSVQVPRIIILLLSCLLGYAISLNSYIGPINILVLVAAVCCVAQSHRKWGLVLILLYLLHEAQQIPMHPSSQPWILTNFMLASAVYFLGILINLILTNKNAVQSQQILQRQRFHKFLHDEVCGPLSKLIVRLELMTSCKEQQFFSHQRCALSTAREIARATRQTMDTTLEVSTPNYNLEVAADSKQCLSIAKILDDHLNELQSYGFKIEKNIIAAELKLDKITSHTLSSLLREITTNMVKYADLSAPIKIQVFEQNQGFLFRITNSIRPQNFNPASGVHKDGTGLKNMAAEMRKITGNLDYSINHEHFELTCYIPKPVGAYTPKMRNLS